MLNPIRITLVEDDADLCAGWEELLSLEGHSVRSFGHASDFFDRREAVMGCDILVSDYYLPDMNGLDLIRKVRALRPELPLILLTGMRDRAIRTAVEQIPRAAYLTKPIRIEQLEACILQLMTDRAA